MEDKPMVSFWFRCPDLSLEVVILYLGGVILAEAAALLGIAFVQELPYYANGLYGLLLVLFALQTIAMGKTPLGIFGRSPGLLIVGGMIASIGVTACCIPSFQEWPRWLVLLYLGGGSCIELVSLMLAKDKMRQWWQLGGLFRHLLLACAGVYLFSICIALVLWKAYYLPLAGLIIFVSVYALAIFYLAATLQKIHTTYLTIEPPRIEGIELSAIQAVLLLLAIFLTLLGLLLIPVGIGLLPFAASAQIGLLMVFFALQMLAAGETPIGSFPRNGLMIACGFIFAGAGIVSCVIPELILQPLTLLIGLLNIANGLVTLRNCWQIFQSYAEELPPGFRQMQKQLLTIQTILGVLNVLFGTSMLLPGVVPAVVTGMILTANGIAMLFLVHLLVQINYLKG